MEKNIINILLVGDDKGDCKTTIDLLSEVNDTDYKVQWVTTYDTALEEISRNSHDICIFNYHLDKLNGLELLQYAVANDCKAPVILFTVLGDKKMDMEALKAGAADFLVKGQFNSSMIDRSIRYAIERRNMKEASQKSLENLSRKHEELKNLFMKVEISKQEWEKNMDCIRDMIILTDSEGKIKRVNRAVKEFTKQTYEEILGKNWEEIIYENDLEAKNLYAGCAELVQRRTRKHFIFRAYTSEDSDTGFLCNAITIHDTTFDKRI